jgi:hypothetical protein
MGQARMLWAPAPQPEGGRADPVPRFLRAASLISDAATDGLRRSRGTRRNHSRRLKLEHIMNEGAVFVAEQLHNPKLDEHPGSNTEKDPDDWVSGDEPMTGAQASYLTTLSEQANLAPPAANLSKAEASKLIDELKARLGLEG